VNVAVACRDRARGSEKTISLVQIARERAPKKKCLGLSSLYWVETRLKFPL